ncbi:DUF3823 domain-containing protein [Chitinophaga sp. SYP-B3965]|uniref:DUF3823 domain-containing protein n=1 Tax=Chitinophaga sp. SYP-B3965 TaxID=2663120 RepID=UPI0012998F97|nr:DUF3823 domain-containing protein [Chitinophaga sp. SYP-B3965]MRG43886.1 DUF3823 domain-containing protein [Chitinophaga sp. SYP-B3965]
MKKLSYILLISALAASSCKKDNYDGPTAGLSGNFFDVATKALVEQDIIRGTQIEIQEKGYVVPQYLIVKNDGTYSNTLLFAATYTVKPIRTNFIALEAQEVTLNGQTTLDFNVTPYIRVTNASIVKSGTKVIATFKLQQNVINNVNKIGLYAHEDFRVGEPMRQAETERDLNAVSDPNATYTLEMDIPTKDQLKTGKSYYFRIGARIDIGEARFNYAPTVKIDL